MESHESERVDDGATDPGVAGPIKVASSRSAWRRVVLVGATTLGLGLTGVGVLSAATSVVPFNDVPGCGIVYADGTQYWGELSKLQLVEAPKEVRRLRGAGGWKIVLKLKPPHDSEAKDHYQMLDRVTDERSILQAVQECIIDSGDP